MRTSILLGLVFFTTNSWAGGLPKYVTHEGMGIQTLPTGKKIPVNMSFQVPPGYKMSFSPQLKVFEKQQGEWVLRQTLKEDIPLFRTTNSVRFTKAAQFENENSEVAFDLSVAFCKKICVINNFQSELKRDRSKTSQIVNINLKGYLPQDKIKKEFQLKGS